MTQDSGSHRRYSTNEAPQRFLGGLALGRAPSGVGAGGWVVAEPSHHDGVERPVELPVTRTIQPMPGDLAR
jgi:hypothetical protein